MNTYLVLGASAALNIAVLALYGWDKRKARKGAWRVSESALIAAALLAPLGQTAGMLIFRHKTRKGKFLLVYVFLALHIAVLVWLRWSGRL